MKLTTTNLQQPMMAKFALLTLLTLGTLISLPSHATTLSAAQQQVVKSHFNKLARSQQLAEDRMTEQLDQEFSRQLAEQEHQLMRETCPRYGMTFDVSSNACLRS
ncbi:hypothetical protein D0436_03585 [Shewanella decolorationis]|uniref:Uncharacterized protein n=1 Tax=Shewanella decolorationis TaxID=256839 RepID=A0A5B8QSK3_9GAMM|nr:hypothetical protein [Shewanella decolorationis]QDZ89620.1 hypothetical protein D0436_03585 [Shewanella decolorationis]